MAEYVHYWIILIELLLLLIKSCSVHDECHESSCASGPTDYFSPLIKFPFQISNGNLTHDQCPHPGFCLYCTQNHETMLILQVQSNSLLKIYLTHLIHCHHLQQYPSSTALQLATHTLVRIHSREYAVAMSSSSESIQLKQTPLAAGSKRLKIAAKWRPPVDDRIKVNMDASWKENGKAAGGIIGRNCRGKIELLHACAFTANSPLLAEAIVLREAVNMVINLGIRRVIFESDCLQVVQACRKMRRVGVIQGVIDDIHQMAQSLEICGFTWVQRTGNQVAHLIAKLKAHNQLNQCWSLVIPSQILQAVDQDMR